MATDLLIRRLCDDLRPTDLARRPDPLNMALLTALGFTVLLAQSLLGMRADLFRAMSGPIFWFKLGAMAWLGGRAALAVRRLGTPGPAPLRVAPLLLPPVLLLAGTAAVQLVDGAGGAAFWLGSSWRRCSATITLLAMVPLASLMVALRRSAPTDPQRIGLIAGLAAGGLAAAVYSLSCGEVSAGFVLLWYGLGIAASALVGRLLGPGLLRW